MQILGLMLVQDFARSHADARAALHNWAEIVRQARWSVPRDVLGDFPRASLLPRRRVVFRIRGNNYRLLGAIDFVSQIVVVMRIGTHAEYDHWDLR